MKLTWVIMEMIMGKEVDVKVDWEVDDVGEDVPSLGKTSREDITRNLGPFFSGRQKRRLPF